jgi:hypothetical protein
MAGMCGRNSRITALHWPICSGVLASAIFHKGGLISGMEFLSPVAQRDQGQALAKMSRERFLQKSFSAIAICPNLEPL